jgi:alkanesulfonate monooxygenase SsuD/methylene tetrahydromethanopterin reductase-like flavin-dependent oxidoreductase (luciferase family)
MKIRIGYGLGTQGIDHAPGEGGAYDEFVDTLERLRFDSVWFSERLRGNAPDPCALMAYTAGRTRNLKLGMSVMVLPGRNPVLVAKELASIALLAGPGRLLPAFGLGAPDPTTCR